MVEQMSKFKLIYCFSAAATDSSEKAILYLTLIIAGSGFHNSAIVVNPSDLAPKHSGSVFGFMNTIGAIPGEYYIFCIQICLALSLKMILRLQVS